MFFQSDISWVHWTVFVLAVLVFLALDLGVFHRKARTVRFREALAWTSLWFSLAMLFGLGLRLMPHLGPEPAALFITGYLIELSLSMDNVFVIALIFRYFKVPSQYQHRVLFWGILGALIMRGVMIAIGVALIERFQWMLYLFGIFLLYTGIRMTFNEQDEVNPEKNPFIQLGRRFFRISPNFEGQKFSTVVAGKRLLTPLALVLVMVETTDLIFALDSIPAIFGITQDPFLVFTSNVFAILGLRSLYFVLAGAISYFAYLKYGLSLVLVFIGVKMLIQDFLHIPVGISLGVVVSIIFTSILVSVLLRVRK